MPCLALFHSQFFIVTLWSGVDSYYVFYWTALDVLYISSWYDMPCLVWGFWSQPSLFIFLMFSSPLLISSTLISALKTEDMAQWWRHWPPGPALSVSCLDPTGQSDKDISSVEVPLPQITLSSVNLTKKARTQNRETYPAQSRVAGFVPGSGCSILTWFI